MKSIDKNNLIMVESIDLSQFSDDIFDEMRHKIGDSERKNAIIDKDNKMVWIVFGNMIGNRIEYES